MKPIKAWHFVGKTLRDGRPIPADGEWLKHEGPVVLCEQGLHASVVPFHALRYAPGPVLCEVLLRGVIKDGGDKHVATERMITRRMDFSEPMKYFARMKAVSLLHLHRKCPADVVLDYLMTGDEELAMAAFYHAQSGDRRISYACHTPVRAAWDIIWAHHRSAEAIREFNELVYECFR